MHLNISYITLSKITSGVLSSPTPSRVIQALKIDSREIQEGDCFLALKGLKHDAHKFIGEVLSKGAGLIICNKGCAQDAAAANTSYIEVDDTLKALQQIAKYHRESSPVKIAAITGSNGKSTTKQMLYSIASKAAKTCASAGNFNNHIGAPLSLLELTNDDVYGIFELGASHKGDIDEIAQIALPNVAILTNVSAAHLEFFGNLETVFQTKTEIVNSLNSSGTLVYNLDDELLRRLKTSYEGKSISYGYSKEADIIIEEGDNFAFSYKGASFNFNIKLERHNKYNAAAACGGAIALGLFKDQIEKGLEQYTPMPLRLEEQEKSGVKFILDCYNANPASMDNALNVLVSKNGVPVAVLGDMRELGSTSKNYHEKLAKQIIKLGIKNIFLGGEEVKHTFDVLKNHPDIMVKYSQSWQDIPALLRANLPPNAVVLIKASRALNFENIFKEF